MRYLLLTILLLTPKLVSADVLLNNSVWHNAAIIPTMGSSSYKSIDNIDYIGNFQGGTQNWGVIDDLRVYNIALTPGEIYELFEGGASGHLGEVF